VTHERMRKLVALPILSSDALSSVAYGPEAMFAVRALAGSGALGLSLPIALAIVVLMLAVGFSYRQLIRAYLHGGGSYLVAHQNLGELPAPVAAAGLLIDYVAEWRCRSLPGSRRSPPLCRAWAARAFPWASR
jgi:amino acid transporter